MEEKDMSIGNRNYEDDSAGRAEEKGRKKGKNIDDAGPQPQYMRLSELTKNTLAELASKSNESMDAFINRLINIYKLEDNKNSMPGQETVIERFSHHIDALVESFNFSLNYAAETDERIRREFANRMDADAETIKNLHSQVNELKISLETSRMMCAERTEEINKHINEIGQYKSQINTIQELSNELRAKNTDLTDMLTDYKKDREDNKLFIQEINSLKGDINSYTLKMSNLESQIIKLKSMIEQEQENKDNEISILNQTHQNEIKSAILDLRQEYDIKLQEKESSYRANELAYHDNIKKLMDELEKVRQDKIKIQEELLKKK